MPVGVGRKFELDFQGVYRVPPGGGDCELVVAEKEFEQPNGLAFSPDESVMYVNDRRDLYPEILSRAGLRLDDRLRRHVNRRTGRRAGEFFEDVLVAVPE